MSYRRGEFNLLFFMFLLSNFPRLFLRVLRALRAKRFPAFYFKEGVRP